MWKAFGMGENKQIFHLNFVKYFKAELLEYSIDSTEFYWCSLCLLNNYVFIKYYNNHYIKEHLRRGALNIYDV